jgi:Bacteriophage Sf6, terminase small subunit-like
MLGKHIRTLWHKAPCAACAYAAGGIRGSARTQGTDYWRANLTTDTTAADALRARARDDRGRLQSTYTVEVADRICRLVIQGMSLARVCRIRGMPSVHTVICWRREHPEFAALFEMARRDRADARADRIEREIDATTPWNALSQRVRIDGLKWLASKDNASRYGDRLDLALPPPPPQPVDLLEVARRQAFIFELARRELEGRHQPLLIELKAEPEPPIYTEVDRRPKPAADDPLRALSRHREDLARVREDTAHETTHEQGRADRGQQRAILARRPMTGRRGE